MYPIYIKIKFLLNFKKLLQIVVLTFLTQFSLAGTDMTIVYAGPLNYIGPADAMGVGQPIGRTWIATANQQVCHSPAMDIARAVIVPISSPTSLRVNIDGIVYPVFETHISGVGWIMSIKDTHAYYYTALNNTENQWYPSAGTDNNHQIDIGGSVKLTFVKTKTHLISGTSTIPAQNLAKIVCYRQNGSVADQAWIKTQSEIITVQASGCTITTPSNATLNLGDFSANNFPSVGSTAGNAAYSIALSCDANVDVKATASDQSNSANQSSIMGLTPSSTARGLGVQVFYNGSSTALSLGPDSTSAGNLNQFSIKRTSSNNQIVNVPLQFKYIRTGTISAGTANAIAGITFSYQ